MVRRAATEAMCNLASHPDAIKNFQKKDKMKIWLAIAEDFESDMQTSKAAMGALAMAAADEGEKPSFMRV